MNPLLLTDFYKVSHPFQYPKNTKYVYSNLTARRSRNSLYTHAVFFGLQYFIEEYLITRFNRDFFKRPKQEVLAEYKIVCDSSVGGLPSYQHIEDLHDLGYLPICIKAVEEGTLRFTPLTVSEISLIFVWK